MIWMRLLTILGTIAMFAKCSTAAGVEEDESFVVAYRLTEKKTMEFDDPAKAKSHIAALQKLGCKSASESHEGHIDVTYQQPRWTAATFSSEELVHKWQDWLNDAGFETLHSEDPAHAEEHADHKDDHGHEHEGVEVLAFQTKDWVLMEFKTTSDAEEFLIVCKALGCEVKESVHEGHPDVQFRCVKPRHIECAGHEATEAREEWLAKLGFQVQHDDHKE